MTQPTFKNSDDAFSDAIAAGRLVSDENSPMYAGNWMYMGTWDGVDSFKNTMTRRYLDEQRSVELAIAWHQLNIIPAYGHRFCRTHNHMPARQDDACPKCVEIVGAP